MPAILKPVVVLVLWSIVMFIWAAVARSHDPKARKVGMTAMKRPAAIHHLMSPFSQNKIDNYNHLMEQPTIFYAIVVVLAVSGGSTPVTTGLSWAYITSRLVHSVVQATGNDVRIRLPLFLIGTLLIVALGINAATIALSS